MPITESPVDLAFAVKLAPEKAVDYFRQKGYELTWDWFEMWQEAHAKAFTVAKVMRMDVLQDIRGLVDKSLGEGMGWSDFQREMRSLLARKGWGPEGPDLDLMGVAAPWRVKTIYETNMQTALMVGRYGEMMENVDDRPYWMYVAVMDSRTRPAHAALHGKVFRYDDPFWDHFYPPNGFRCRCRVRALTAGQVQAQGIKVETADGKLGTIEKLVSHKTGELIDVAEYTDPFTGLKVSPDVGWDYNPGKAAWIPDLRKYDTDIRKLYEE